MKLTRYRFGLMLLILVSVMGCKKSFLDEKPNTGIVVPKTLKEIQGLLDHTYTGSFSTTLGMFADNEFSVSQAKWESNPPLFRTSYLWADQIYEVKAESDWDAGYRGIFYANVALQVLSEMPEADRSKPEWNKLRGAALFYRAHHYFNLAQIYTLPYHPQRAATDLGLPLKTSADIDDIQPRSNLQLTYDFIEADLTASVALLPATPEPVLRNRPSKASAYALMSRIALCKGDFVQAELSADQSMTLYGKLIDYNTISPSASYPFSNSHDELLQFAQTANSIFDLFPGLYNRTSIINSELYNAYADNDLRKTIFFMLNSANEPNIKFGYQGNSAAPFSGIATDEVYLNKAECQARIGAYQEAMTTLNLLLVKRFKSGTFVPYSAANAAEALQKVLTERRKELVWRGIRWLDIRRLNSVGANITLTRTMNGKTYTLAPNSLKYAFPIPPAEIAVSGIEQNAR